MSRYGICRTNNRALSTISFFEERDDGRWQHTPHSDLLRTNHPLSMKYSFIIHFHFCINIALDRMYRPLALMLGGAQYVAMSSLAESIRLPHYDATSSSPVLMPVSAYEHKFSAPFWADLGRHPSNDPQSLSGL
jgi:hypothetical protein